MKKFDDCLEQRQEYKQKMRKHMQFHNPDKNTNVEASTPGPDDMTKTFFLKSWAKSN